MDFKSLNDDLSKYSLSTHNHDSRYYTETEVNNLLGNKQQKITIVQRSYSAVASNSLSTNYKWYGFAYYNEIHQYWSDIYGSHTVIWTVFNGVSQDSGVPGDSILVHNWRCTLTDVYCFFFSTQYKTVRVSVTIAYL